MKPFIVTKILAMVLASLVLILPAASVHAISAKDKNAVINDTVFYDDSDTTTFACTATGSTVLTGNDNMEKAYNFFVGKGFQPYQAAGVIGNLVWESGGELDPTIVQGGARADNPVSGKGYGIAQWTSAGRQQGLVSYASQNGGKPGDLAVQLDYLWYELNSTEKKALTSLQASTDLNSATKAFMDDFERPGDPRFADRLAGAQSILNLYGNGAPANNGTATESTATGGCGGTGGLGVNGDFTFPMQTTQAALTGHKPTWCYTSQASCHHDYVAADIFNDEGTTNVVAVAGKVMKADDVACHGGYDVPRVQIKGDDGTYYYYTHMRPGSIQVTAGQHVAAGTPLGVIGPRECAEGTDPHLHFQMSSVPIQSTQNTAERANYINPQPNLIAAFSKLPAQ